jgi:hypothetical protein
MESKKELMIKIQLGAIFKRLIQGINPTRNDRNSLQKKEQKSSRQERMTIIRTIIKQIKIITMELLNEKYILTGP